MTPPPYRATVVVSVPHPVEFRARQRAIRNGDRDRLLAYVLDEVDVDFDLFLYHEDDPEIDRSTATLALSTTIDFTAFSAEPKV